MVFDGVLDGDYFDAGIMYLAQECIERRRLSASRRPRVEYHAVGLRYLAVEDFHQVFVEAERLHRQRNRRGVQNTHDNGFRIRARQDRSTYLDFFLVDHDGEAAVLRRVFYVELESREELDAARDKRVSRRVKRRRFDEHAVETVAHAYGFFFRFEVYVARTERKRPRHDDFKHARDAVRVLRTGIRLYLKAYIFELLQFLEHLIDCFIRQRKDARFRFRRVRDVVVAVPCMIERRLGNDKAPHRVPELLDVLNCRDGVWTLRRAHREEQIFVHLVEGRYFCRARDLLFDDAQRVGINGFGCQVHVLDAVFARQHFRKLLLLLRAQLQEPLVLLFLVELRGHSLYCISLKQRRRPDKEVRAPRFQNIRSPVRRHHMKRPTMRPLNAATMSRPT